ncbi:MAG TPA: hypothetical protein VFK57_05285 [Vicinamibacterales bacterium]|nr:hypothetical protein [Vicinamibacterales bacterium]
MQRTKSLTRGKAVWGGRVVRLGLAVLVLLSASCSKTIRTGQASSYLVITSLVGGPQSDNTVESDVISDEGTVFTDVAEATFQLQMKDPNGLGPGPVNAITLTQYRVEYVRSDGRNVEGVDVPFSFTSGVTATISGSGSVGFTLVRLQAKQEAPLRALRSGGGARIISTIARITFYGHDQTGREVSVTGNLDVTFADWAG